MVVERTSDGLRLRILHVINQFSGNAGAEISLRNIILGTQGERFEHGIAVLRGPHDFAGLAGMGVVTFTPGQDLGVGIGAVRHVARAVRSFQPDLVTTALFDAGVVGRIAGRVCNVPVLTTLVNTAFVPPEAVADSGVSPRKLALVRSLDAFLGRYLTTAFHAITSAVADDAVDQLGIDRCQVHVVPRGRDRRALGYPSASRRARVRSELGLEPSQTVLISVGRQEAQKGHTYLLEALPAIRRDHPDVVLLLVGRDGGRTETLRRQVVQYDLDEAVRMLGFRRDVPDLLSASDLFIFPSLYEGLGGALVEAMALEVPVIATDIPAVREVLDDGRCGLLVRIADPRAIAEAVDDVLRNRDEAERRVEAAAQRFESTYELQGCLAAMSRLYERLAPSEADRSSDS